MHLVNYLFIYENICLRNTPALLPWRLNSDPLVPSPVCVAASPSSHFVTRIEEDCRRINEGYYVMTPPDIYNYRPVSLLPCVSKVFEKLIFQHIFSYLRHNAILSPHQSGFINEDSCGNQLACISHNIYKELDKNNSVRAVFLDFAKAFDKVSHKGLIYKFKKYGVTGNILSWLTNYLTNRSQKVVIKGSSSDWRYIKSGVPQGSVLGPLCFLIYINDITENISSSMFLFADDASIFRPIQDTSAREDSELINEDLKTIEKWASQWKLKLSIPKTVAIMFSRKRVPPTEHPLLLNNIPLKIVKFHKYLGITFSADMQLSHHIDCVTSHAYKRINMMRFFKYKWSTFCLSTCYKSFVRPVLKYGDIVYSSCKKADAAKLESV